MVEIVGEHVSLDVKQTFLSDERNSAEVITRVYFRMCAVNNDPPITRVYLFLPNIFPQTANVNIMHKNR
jgi:hypothetical protein